MVESLWMAIFRIHNPLLRNPNTPHSAESKDGIPYFSNHKLLTFEVNNKCLTSNFLTIFLKLTPIILKLSTGHHFLESEHQTSFLTSQMTDTTAKRPQQPHQRVVSNHIKGSLAATSKRWPHILYTSYHNHNKGSQFIYPPIKIMSPISNCVFLGKTRLKEATLGKEVWELLPPEKIGYWLHSLGVQDICYHDIQSALYYIHSAAVLNELYFSRKNQLKSKEQ